jgi:hypothetical protein
MKCLLLVLVSILAIGCKETVDSATFSYPGYPGVELSETECRKVSDDPILYAISGQVYGTQVYTNFIACDTRGATWYDMGEFDLYDEDFDNEPYDGGPGYPNLSMRLSHVDGIAFLLVENF